MRLKVQRWVVVFCLVSLSLNTMLFLARFQAREPPVAVAAVATAPGRASRLRRRKEPLSPKKLRKAMSALRHGDFPDAVMSLLRRHRTPKPHRDLGVGRASKWSKRLAWSPRPPINSTLQDDEDGWLPTTGGVCDLASGNTQRPTSMPTTLSPTTEADAQAPGRRIPPAVLDRVRAFDKAHGIGSFARRRRRLMGESEVFQLPVGCAPLARRLRMNTTDDDSPRDTEADERKVFDDDDYDVDRDYCDAVTCMPNLYMLGASKAGTTTLYEALSEHPRVVDMFTEPFTSGETHAFTEPRDGRENVARCLRRTRPIDRRRVAGLQTKENWTLADADNVGGPMYVLEYTPHYLVLPGVRGRICDSMSRVGLNCADSKYIVMVRDPSKRAFSQWVMKTHMRIALYNDKRTFAESSLVGMKRTKKYADCWAEKFDISGDASPREYVEKVLSSAPAKIHRVGERKCAPTSFEPNLFQAYVLKSAYFYQLLPWVATVKEGNILLSTLESFGVPELKRIFDFAGLGTYATAEREGFRSEAQLLSLATAKHNIARDGGTGSIDPAEKATLDEFFAPMNALLDALIETPKILGRPTGYSTSARR